MPFQQRNVCDMCTPLHRIATNIFPVKPNLCCHTELCYHISAAHFNNPISSFKLFTSSSHRVLCCAAVLQGLDLILPKGTITAVVGRSGAGKSTVASLLSRFYEPDSGAIWLGGKPAADFTRGEWAKAVALVSQEPVLFSGQSEVSRWLIISVQCALKT